MRSVAAAAADPYRDAPRTRATPEINLWLQGVEGDMMDWIIAGASWRATQVLLASTILIGSISNAEAVVTITNKSTKNMTCSAGVCTPTAPKANLKVTELADMLASGDVKIIADSAAEDIRFAAPLSWTSTSRLTLDAYESITIEQALIVAGKGALTIIAEDGGSSGDYWFPANGHVEFWDAKSKLSINGVNYKIVKGLGQLALAVNKNPAGAYALSKSYDATKDGVYARSPVETAFYGNFEGLGNTISNVTIDDAENNAHIGLFSSVSHVRNLNVTDIKITAHGTNNTIGGLAGSAGTIRYSGARGSISGSGTIGGLVGTGPGTFRSSYADVDITIASGIAGGLVGHPYTEGDSTISGSYATGAVSGGDDTRVGGLVGWQEQGFIIFSYATGPVTGGANSDVGGLIGISSDLVAVTYSIGAVNGGTGSHVGGLMGGGYYIPYGDNYWDVDTSGTKQGTGGGNVGGVTGLTTQQFKSGLPEGFEQGGWAQKKTINNGYPYLLVNPPR